MKRNTTNLVFKVCANLLATTLVVGLAVWLIIAPSSPFTSRENETSTLPQQPTAADFESSSPASPLDLLGNGLWDLPNTPWRWGASKIDQHDDALERLRSRMDIKGRGEVATQDAEQLISIIEGLNPRVVQTDEYIRYELESDGTQLVLITGFNRNIQSLRLLLGKKSPYTLVTMSARRKDQTELQNGQKKNDWDLPQPENTSVVATRHDVLGVTSVKVLELTKHPSELLEYWQNCDWTVDRETRVPGHWSVKNNLGSQYSITHHHDGGTHNVVIMRLASP